MRKALLTAKEIVKTYHGAQEPVLNQISAEIYQGDFTIIMGPSGAGKSTLLYALSGMDTISSGQVLYNGEDIVKYSAKQMKEMRKKMQIIFQDPFTSLNPRMSVSEIIAEPMITTKYCTDKKERLERVFRLMETVGLAERFINSYPHELDGGRRQRIGIARALAVAPEFIVCDEPVSALDVSIQAQILNLMMDLQDNMGLTYMFVTHNLSVIKHISSNIAVMYLGQCVEFAPTQELFDHPEHPYTQALLNAIPIASLKHRKKLEIIKGEVTSPINPKPGCRFADRCPYATAKCREEGLKLQEISKGHFVACRLHEK